MRDVSFKRQLLLCIVHPEGIQNVYHNNNDDDKMTKKKKKLAHNSLHLLKTKRLHPSILF